MAAIPTIEMPEPEGSHLNFMTNEDRLYFEAHPLAKFYDRSPHPSEFWPQLISTKGVIVRVFQITPGYRIRCPYREGDQPDKKTVRMIKELWKSGRKDKLRIPLQDARLEDIHFVVG